MASKMSEHQRNEIWRERVRKEEAAQVVVTDFNFTLGQTAGTIFFFHFPFSSVNVL
jgi:hypothetical protein